MSYSFFSIGYGMIPTASTAEVKQAVQEIAPAIIEEQVGTVVGTTVDTKIQEAAESGLSDDVRIDSFANFPRPGVSGVEYIDTSTGWEYYWDDSANDYILINGHTALSNSEINSIFN